MDIKTRSRLLWSGAAVLGILALVFLISGIALIWEGAYPPEGSGSLGHVGIVIAGIIAAFVALICGLFSVLCISKARRKKTIKETGFRSET